MTPNDWDTLQRLFARASHCWRQFYCPRRTEYWGESCERFACEFEFVQKMFWRGCSVNRNGRPTPGNRSSRRQSGATN